MIKRHYLLIIKLLQKELSNRYFAAGTSITWVLLMGTFGLFVATGCKKPKDDNTQVYGREKMLENLGRSVLQPQYNDFKAQSDKLVQAMTLLGQQTTVANLDSIKAQWRKTASIWCKIEACPVGPAKTLRLLQELNSWQTDSVKIETIIADCDTPNLAYLNTQGVTVKGLPAIEYLLFARDGSTTVAALTTQPRASARMQLLTALCQHLNNTAAKLATEWSNSYINTYTQSDNSQPSIDATVNELIAAVEVFRNDKLGRALGKKNDGVVQPFAVQSPFSHSSITHLQDNVASLKAVFNGKEGEGFDNYLDFLTVKSGGELLSQKINTQIDSIQTSLTQLQGPLETTVATNPQAVEAIYSQLTALIVLLKVDMATGLGVTITFSDSDGD